MMQQVYAQSNYVITGKVVDQESNEELPGTIVSVPYLKIGTATDIEGNFNLQVNTDTITLLIENIGYKKQSLKLNSAQYQNIKIKLQQDIKEVQEVIVYGDPVTEKINTTQMGKVTITSKEIKDIPVIFGEPDILKAIQLKPGVQSGGEGQTGLYVRGGGPDQNLFLMDDAIVYNPAHLFGLFSIFNTDAVRSIDLYKGDFPAEYGGRLSSVVDIKPMDGNNDKITARGGLGLIASRLTIDGPVKKDKSTFLIGGRRTYFDVFTAQLNRWNANNPDWEPIPKYNFYDLNGRFTYNFSKRSRVTYTGYYGRDRFGFETESINFRFNWGNLVNSLKWHYDISENLTSTSSISFSEYRYVIKNSFRDFTLSLGSIVSDYTARTDFFYTPSRKHHIKFGGLATYHTYVIGRLSGGNSEGTVRLGAGQTYDASEAGIYISDEYDINVRWKANMGLRLTGFFNDKNNFTGLEPRLSIRYLLNERTSLKASYARMFQYVHLVSNSGASLPTDIWFPSGNVVKPQKSDQVAGGISIALFKDKIFLTDEVYYKEMRNITDFREGARIFANDQLEHEFILGRGWAYGNEIYIEKKHGKTTGWIGYTLSWSWRRFDEINYGRRFPARYDRRHDISTVVIHRLTDRLKITGAWIYGTGNAITLPIGRIVIQDVPGATPMFAPDYTERNSFRMPAYHRMDLGLVYQFKPKRGESDLTLSIYNVYNRRNAYFIYFAQVKNEDDVTVGFQAKQVSLFPIIPSLTYNFKF
ncbi:MAG: TonB-dependent receptor [Cytophagaceae bacterium]